MGFDDELRSRGFGEGVGLGERPALVVVDATLAFTDPSSPLDCGADSAVDAIARLLTAARSASAPVVFSSVVVGDEAREKAAHFLRKMPGLLSIDESPRYSEIDSRVAPNEDEQVITKIFPSAFFNTALNDILSEREVDTVVVTGMSTSGCVRATVVDALQHGYRVAVVPEAVADRDEAAGAANLRDLELKYADLVPLEQMLTYMKGLTDES